MKTKIALAVVAAASLSCGAAVNIDGGRQLFVDDYVIGSTNGVVRYWNAATKAPTPVVRPTSEKGGRVAGCTVATNGGLWWDPTVGKYRLWYETDWAGNLRYAESKDGLSWEYPDLGKVKGTNRVFGDDEEKLNRSLDSWSVWPDYKAANPYGRWNLLVSAPGSLTTDTLYSSADGRTFATLRRDGFAGLVADGEGEVVTKSVVFSGAHLFVNADCLCGDVGAEICDETGRPLKGFAAADCRAMTFADATKRELVFAGGDLRALAGKTVKIRFRLHCATHYSFWVSPSPRGESRGYVAAGGPAYPGLRDL